jgi:hypothetical protein
MRLLSSPGITLAGGSGSRSGRVARWSPDGGHARLRARSGRRACTGHPSTGPMTRACSSSRTTSARRLRHSAGAWSKRSRRPGQPGSSTAPDARRSGTRTGRDLDHVAAEGLVDPQAGAGKQLKRRRVPCPARHGPQFADHRIAPGHDVSGIGPGQVGQSPALGEGESPGDQRQVPLAPGDPPAAKDVRERQDARARTSSRRTLRSDAAVPIT